MSRPSVLLVLTRIDWIGTARMPRVLAKAGFDVAVLAPRNSFTEKSEYVARMAYVAADTTPLAWLEAVLAMVEETAPRLIVPGDELALRLLFWFVLDPPAALPMAQRIWVRQLVIASLGAPAHYATSVDKTLLPPAVEALGVRVPRYAIARSVDEAVAHAEGLGWPVALKAKLGSGGEGVAIVGSVDGVAGEAAQLLRPEPLDLGDSPEARLLVQAFQHGPHHSQAIVAHEGRILAGFSWERFVLTREVKGQTSVLRFIESPRAWQATERFTKAFGITGFCNIQYIVDEASGEPCLIEINRRVSTHMNVGERVGCDLGQALYAALAGRDVPAPVPRIDGVDPVNVFPREWLRDPRSPHLDRYPADIPWDEPRLIAAMAAVWRNE